MKPIDPHDFSCTFTPRFDPEELAECCKKAGEEFKKDPHQDPVLNCPVHGFVCPFDFGCEEVVPSDWEKLFKPRQF